MRFLNFGSINIDHVYSVEHFVRPGETLASLRYQVFAGGKGLNQSIALARAGAPVFHAGKVGRDGSWLAEELDRNGVNAKWVHRGKEPTGHAIIQVAQDGQNAILLYPGANHSLESQFIEQTVQSFDNADCLLIQNETNAIDQIIQAAAGREMTIAFNPAPMTAAVRNYPLELVNVFFLNETEAEALTGETDPHRAGIAMRRQFPNAATVLTLGSRGAAYFGDGGELFQPATAVQAIDTTAAGDTFLGYFLAEYCRSLDAERALMIACRAASICVTRPGAADSIPYLHEVEG
jgi:ribokinase